MSRYVVCSLVIAMALSGCAKVRFHADPDLKKETGLRFYSAKPYLLVARTGAKDKPTEVTVMHLPDLQAPQYVSYRAGFGSNDIDIALQNSILTSYGYATDPKVAETLAALGSLTTATSGIAKTIAEAGKIDAEALKLLAEADELRAEASPEEIRDAASTIKQVAADLDEAVKAMGVSLDTTAKTEATKIATELLGIVVALESPTASTQLGSIVTRLRMALDKGRWENLKHVSTQADPFNFNHRMDKDKKQLEKALKLLDPPVKTVAAPTFELYEIKQEQGVTRLIRVAPQ